MLSKFRFPSPEDHGWSAASIVPKEEWNHFLKEVSQLHRGWLTSLETTDHVTQETVTTQEMLLQSIELDTEDEKNPRINVIVRIDNKIFKHILFLPSRLILHASRDGRESLEVETVNTSTRVHLQPPDNSLPVI